MDGVGTKKSVVFSEVELPKARGGESSFCEKMVEIVKRFLATIVYYLTCCQWDLSKKKTTRESLATKGNRSVTAQPITPSTTPTHSGQSGISAAASSSRVLPITNSSGPLSAKAKEYKSKILQAASSRQIAIEESVIDKLARVLEGYLRLVGQSNSFVLRYLYQLNQPSLAIHVQFNKSPDKVARAAYEMIEQIQDKNIYVTDPNNGDSHGQQTQMVTKKNAYEVNYPYYWIINITCRSISGDSYVLPADHNL